jgi:glyceraldehyde-3-phosphate dehydrogenase [NAD(P)+]
MNLKITTPGRAEALGEVVQTPPSEVAPIVAAAARAQPAWARLPIAQRAEMIDSAADALSTSVPELGRLLAAESGKPLAQAEFEVEGAIGLLRGNAEEGRRLGGRVLPTEGNAGTEWDLVFTRREPLGVVAAILPFNFPVELFVEKCAAALVAGNAVVVKPPPEDPLTVESFRVALVEAGLPAEVVTAVHGGADVGAALASAPSVAAVSLTGSTAAGIAVAEAAAPTLRTLHLELGGNNACLVRADADLDLVTTELTRGRLLMNGQACAASKRIIVDSTAHDDLAARLGQVISRQRVGPATDPETTVGPLITPAAADRVAGQVTRAREEGAELLAGPGASDGAYFAPSLLGSVPVDAAVARDDEIFGPVFALIPVEGDEEALKVANASSFGLMASVFSADVQRAFLLGERIEAGGVVINGTDNYRPPVIPFGGVKLSGHGREGLGYTIAELSREKTFVLRRFRAPGVDL